LLRFSRVELLNIQAEALFTHDARGRIVAVNEPGGDRAPLFFLARSPDGHIWRCRDDVPDKTARTLERLVREDPVDDHPRAEPRALDTYLTLLNTSRATATIWSGPAYSFPKRLEVPSDVTRITAANLTLLTAMVSHLDDVTSRLETREPVCAVIEDGLAVSLCYSSRLTDRAAEAGVETVEGRRGRGYASMVVAAWARAVREGGRVPLYSTSWDNAAAQAVARQLGLQQYGSNVSIGSS